MKFSILVLGSPYNSAASYSALRFCESVLEKQHEIFRVFFYQDGVHATSALAAPPRDEHDTYSAWQSLQTKHNIDCVTCIAAATRRGILSASEAERYDKLQSNLAEGFSLSGLGQWIEAMAVSDRCLTFGA